MRGFTADDVTAQSGRCFLVTGANAGLGLEAAKVLAARGARVLLGCRDQGKAEQAMSVIRALTPGAELGFVAVDLADLDSVRMAAERVAQDEPRLDVVLNNAGVMRPPLMRTAQGHELQFGVNHLGTFALTGLLLPKLTETANARVVVTASIAHRRGRIDWDDLDARFSYNPMKRYGDSKLMNLLHLFELDRRLRGVGSPVSAIGCHPGVAATELARHLPPLGRALWPVMCKALNSAEAGAWAALQAATDPDAVAGGYYGPQRLFEMRGACGPASRSGAATDPDAAKRLWQISVELTGVDGGLVLD